MQYGLTLAMAPPPKSNASDQGSPSFMVFWYLIIAVVLAVFFKKCMSNKVSRTTMRITGICGIVLGALLFVWARSHSPNMGFGEMMTKLDSYILKPPAYYSSIAMALLLVIAGTINTARSFLAEGAKSLSILGSKESGLDQIKKAKELLDSGAIDATEFEKIKKAALER